MRSAICELVCFGHISLDTPERTRPLSSVVSESHAQSVDVRNAGRKAGAVFAVHPREPNVRTNLSPRKLAFLGLMVAACARESVREKADTAVALQQAPLARETTVVPPPSILGETLSTAAAPLSIADSSAPAALTCKPTTFGPGDTLTLRMWTPHGHYLTVTRSDRISYFVVYPPGRQSKPTYSLMPSDEFTHIATLRLPADVRAIPYVYGRDTILEPVFGASGQYLLQMGDNIGTDYGAPPLHCNLTFVQRASK